MLPLLLLSSLASLSVAIPLQPRSVKWAPCRDIKLNTTWTYDCGTLNVPLDYGPTPKRTVNTTGTIDLQFVRIPAAEQPSKGSVFFNFGGPGFPARNTLVGSGAKFLAATGGEYDLVTFDPRGTGTTIPFNCTSDPTELFSLSDGFTVGTVSEVDGSNFAHAKHVASICAAYHQDIGPFIGTSDFVNDLISAVDAIEDDKMLRFWGISYGTTVGATVAAMYPERIDRIVLDAVQNIHEYYNSPATYQQWEGSDKTFSGIWSTCFDAGPELCPLSASFDNAVELENAVWDLANSLKQHPINAGANESVVVDYPKMRSFIAQNLYSTGGWPSAVAIIQLLLEGETGDDLLAILDTIFTNSPAEGLPEALASTALLGIQCSDAKSRSDTLEELQPALDRLRNTSRVMGDISSLTAMSCATWKFDNKYRYDGEWANLTTHHPMMLVANTFDGHTPPQSAYNTSAVFEDSVVLEINGYGHSSANLVSKCATQHLATYFVNGTLPEPHTMCQVDLLPYHPAPSA
ncbi:hypothetical protein V496_02471 [Pseudogymnoascus sp. VKM F-4515 (FW-2607)]|nr:hypothetical protein V496_02471 [Pseudogymnoascus sp. VKM F-4515 (FW-2607)]KFY98553.1 hypothetical protein V498_01391 [Pseudogymnoascus sp. VKM F-4517 (FW-2822)]